MNEREFEQKVDQLMKLDFSAGTEAFRDELLGRCLVVLGNEDEIKELNDNQLDTLAAAGDLYSQLTPDM